MPCTVFFDECFFPGEFVLARLVPYFLLPEITWVFCGDPHQPGQTCHWRGQMLQRSGLWKGSFSAYLPKDYIWLSQDKRSQCDLLRDYRRRLREARDEDLPSFIAEGRSLFRAPGPYGLSICISHAKRRRISIRAGKNATQR